MKLLRRVILALFALASGLTATDVAAENGVSSAISPNDRYQMVQSELAAKWTFRLDRFCGAVSQLVSTSDGGDAWQPMIVRGLPSCVNDGRSHYQVFTSGLAAKHTMLMNTATGRTWVLVQADNGEALWGEFE